MYKAIFKRKMYEIIPFVDVSYYKFGWGKSTTWTYGFDSLLDADGKIHNSIFVDHAFISDRTNINHIIEEHIINDYLHVLSVGDVINLYGKDLKVIRVSYNSDNSIEYLLEKGSCKVDNYKELYNEAQKELESIEEIISKERKEREEKNEQKVKKSIFKKVIDFIFRK